MRAIREHRDPLIRRVQFIGFVVIAILLVILSGFWKVQISQGESFRSQAENNRLRRTPVRAPRGLIYDRDGELLVENIPSYDLMLDRSRSRNVEGSLRHAAKVLGVPVEELQARVAEEESTPDFKPITLARRLELAKVARFGVSSLEYPEFEIAVEHLRLYRHGPHTGHLLGYLGEVNKEEVEADPEVYDPGDLIGKAGIEKTYDQELRGEDGRAVVVVDVRGRVIEEYGREEATPGKNLTLALDLDLQQEAQRQFQDKVGAAIAMDPKTGEILALYTSPSYDSNTFARGLDSEEWKALTEAEHNPLQNRAIQNAHPPGSVFKIVMGAAGIAEGVITEQSREFCGGGTVIYGRRFGCWKAGGHGSVNLRGALKGSCNVYFYHLGKKLGVERIAKYSRIFGLGSKTGIELRGEIAGLVPDEEWSQRVRGHQWYPGETISLAVGQGALLTTPIQLTRMIGAVANGQRIVHPRLLKSRGAPPETEPFAVPPRALAAVKEGLAAVMEPGGTAWWSAHIEGLPMAGKTGTAQVVGKSVASGKMDSAYEHRTHAWFVSFAPVDEPELVVVVFVEHGGSGSGAAAPIAKALYQVYFEDRLQPDEETTTSAAG
jgi:penicillin-binding protein 2